LKTKEYENTVENELARARKMISVYCYLVNERNEEKMTLMEGWTNMALKEPADHGMRV